MRRTEKAPGNGFLWGDNDAMLGSPAMATTGLPANLTKGTGTNLASLVLGNFDDLILGIWGGAVDILVDPYRFSTSGGIRVHAFLSVDIKLRHAASFIVADDLVTV